MISVMISALSSPPTAAKTMSVAKKVENKGAEVGLTLQRDCKD